VTPRGLLLGLVFASAIALMVLPGRFAGSYATFMDTETLTGSVGSGEWLATITVTKAVDSTQAFAFTTGDTPGCDADTTLANGERFACTFDARGDTTYTISEIAVEGWAAPAIECGPAEGVQVPPDSPDAFSVAFDLEPGDEVACSFTNTPETGDITIQKTASGGAGSTTFDFTSDIPGCEDVAISVAADASNTHVCQDKAAGSYVITEQAEDGWTLADIECTGAGSSFLYGSAEGQTHEAFQAGDTSVAVSLGGGSSVTCEFTNTRDTGSVTITKHADAAGTFSFDLLSLVNAGGTCASSSITVGEPDFEGSVTCVGVPVGGYTIAEEDPGEGWTFVSANCGDGEVTTPSVSLSVTKDQTTSCPFVNQAVAIASTFVQRDIVATGCGPEGATNFTLGTTTAAAATHTESGPAGAVDDVYFTFTSDAVNQTNWAAGNYIVELDITGMGGQVQEYRVQLVRVSSTCGLVGVIGTAAAYQDGTGMKTFMVAGAASTGAATDRLQLRVLVNVGPGNAQGGAARELDLGMNTGNSEVITPW
jgi:hypothetical protein